MRWQMLKPRLLTMLPHIGVAVLAYLGDAGHRRAVSIGLSMVLAHLLGHAVGASGIADVLDLVIGVVGAIWNKNSVQPPEEVTA